MKKLKQSENFLNDAQLRNKATIESRQAKNKSITTTELKALWENDQSKRQIEKHIKRGKSKKINPLEAIKQAAEQIHKTESSFNQYNILNTAFQLSRGVSVDELKKAFQISIHKGLIQSVGQRQTKSGLTIENFATKHMISIEKSIIELFNKGLNSLPSERISIDKRLKPYDYFTQGQRSFVRDVFTSNNQFNLIQGDAGTGKTSAIKAIKEISKTQKLLGLAFTGKAASEIENNGGIPSMTIDQLLTQYNKRDLKARTQDRLTRKFSGIWIVDESSMVGSEQLLKVMKTAKNEGAKVFFIGDSKQLQAISAGKMFKHLQNISKTVELTETMRQKNEIIKTAVGLVKNKHIESCLNYMNYHGNIIEGQSIDRMIHDYIANNGDMIITSRNADRELINEKTRQALKLKGLLESMDIPFQVERSVASTAIDRSNVRNYEVNQEIIINHSDSIQPGSRFIVKSINLKKNELRVRSYPTIRLFDQQTGQFKHVQRKKCQTIAINPMKSDITPVSYQQKHFSRNERIIFLRNDKALNVKNGTVGIIKKLNSNKIHAMVEDREIIFNRKDYASIDHAYALTVYKSQGQTAKNVFIHASEKGMHTTEFLYTALSRASHEAKIYCDNYQKFVNQCCNEQEKQSCLEI